MSHATLYFAWLPAIWMTHRFVLVHGALVAGCNVPLLKDGDELNPSLDPSQSCEYSVTAIEVRFITTVVLVLG